MKMRVYFISLIILILASCKDDDVALFEKTADERVAEAVASLKNELISPANGWRVKYRPEADAGSYYVLMTFNADNTVDIKTDFGQNEGEFFEQRITYRIDNSLGLELILESYSFFSYLFEQDQATFLAEYEFRYVNKTPDNSLVFTSKTDPDTPSILLFEPAGTNDADLLGTDISTNLNIIANDLDKLSSSLSMTYDNKDLVLFIVLDNIRRVVLINSAARKNNLSATQAINFISPFILRGDSLVLDNRFSSSVLGNNVSFKAIRFTTLEEDVLDVCASPIPVHAYKGTTSENDPVRLATSLVDASGSQFATASDFFNAPIEYIFDKEQSAGEQVAADLTGAVYMQLYYDYDAGGGSPFYAMGFYIQNANGTVTFALREFTPTLVGNNLQFSFAPEVSIFGEPNTQANTDNVNIYLDLLTQGDNTFVFQLGNGLYELYNPCTGWSVAFIPSN